MMYCWQGHEKYVNCAGRNLRRNLEKPWLELELSPQEVCKITALNYTKAENEPTLCTVTLSLLGRGIPITLTLVPCFCLCAYINMYVLTMYVHMHACVIVRIHVCMYQTLYFTIIMLIDIMTWMMCLTF